MSEVSPFTVTDTPQPFTVPEHRRACDHCGGREGVIYRRNDQIVVRCASKECSTFNPKLGRGERIYCPSKAEMGVPKRTVSDAREPVPPGVRARVLERDGYRCQLCGNTAETSILHTGHVVSAKEGLEHGLSLEDLNSPDNLMTMCEKCNLGLRSKSLDPKTYVLLTLRREQAAR